MHPNITIQLEQLVKLRHEQPTEIIAEAVQIGMSKLYLESVVEQYLKKRIPRSKAVQLVGLNAVKLAEQQQRVTQHDIVWGLGRG